MKRVIKFFDLLGGLAILTVYCVILIQIIGRVVIKVPTTWTVEVGRILFMIIVFVGAVVLLFEDKLMKVRTLEELVSPGKKRVINIVQHVLMLLFLVPFCFGSYQKMTSNWYAEIPALEWFRTGYLYLVILLIAITMAGIIFRSTYKLISDR